MGCHPTWLQKVQCTLISNLQISTVSEKLHKLCDCAHQMERTLLSTDAFCCGQCCAWSVYATASKNSFWMCRLWPHAINKTGLACDRKTFTAGWADRKSLAEMGHAQKCIWASDYSEHEEIWVTSYLAFPWSLTRMLLPQKHCFPRTFSTLFQLLKGIPKCKLCKLIQTYFILQNTQECIFTFLKLLIATAVNVG